MTTKNYIEKIGRRKTSSARVRITPSAKNTFVVNGVTVNEYFKTPALQKIAHDALSLVKTDEKYDVSVKITGGGIHSQAEALRHGLSRIFASLKEEFKQELGKEGFLERDSRSKERRKFGLKKARKAPQWSKR